MAGIRKFLGTLFGAPVVKVVPLTGSTSGVIYTVSRLLSTTSVFSLVTGSNSNLTINANSGVVSAATAIPVGTSQTAIVRESITASYLAAEYPIVLTGTAAITNLPSLKPVTPVGMNIGSTNYYSENYIFLDRMKTASDWSPTSGASLTKDANGYPTALVSGQHAYTLINIDGPLSGIAQIYIITCANTSVNFYTSGATITSSSIDKNGNRRVVIDASNAFHDQGYYFKLEADAPLSGTPVTVVRQDEETALLAGYIFTPTLLQRLSPFGVLRFMDAMFTNGSIAGPWSSRLLPSYFSWNEIPIEILVALCNTLGCDGWFCVPCGASDDYISQMATLIHSTLNPNLRAYFEYSNECWNGGFGQYHWITDSYTCPVDLGGGYTVYPKYGYLAAHMAAVLLKTTGFSPRIQPVLMGQAGNNSVIQSNISGVQAAIADWSNTASPRYDPVLAIQGAVFGQLFVGGLGAAGYFDGNLSVGNSADKTMIEGWAEDPTDGGLASAFQQLEFGGVLSSSIYALANLAAFYTGLPDIAHSLQVPLIGYEGGLGLQSNITWPDSDPKQGEISAFFQRLCVDPRMRTITLKWFTLIRHIGFSRLCDFNDVGGAASKYGIWGALVDPYHLDSPRYLGLLDFIANPVTLPPLTITTSQNGASRIGTSPLTIITPSGGVGRVTVTVSGLAPGRQFDNFRTLKGNYAQVGTFTTIITATDESGGPSVSCALTQTVTPSISVPGGYVGFRITPGANLGGQTPGAQYWGIALNEIYLIIDDTPLYLTDWLLSTTFNTGYQQNLLNVTDGDITTGWTTYQGSPAGQTITLIAPNGVAVLPNYLVLGAYVNPSDANLTQFSPAVIDKLEGTKDGTTWTTLSTAQNLNYASNIAKVAIATPDYTVSSSNKAGLISVASSPITITLNVTHSTSVVFTPTDGNIGGVFTPSTITIAAGSTTGTFTYTPPSNVITTANTAAPIHLSNNQYLINPDSLIYTIHPSTDFVFTVTWDPNKRSTANGQPTVTLSNNNLAEAGIDPGSTTVTSVLSSVMLSAPTGYVEFIFTNYGHGNGTKFGFVPSNYVLPTNGNGKLVGDSGAGICIDTFGYLITNGARYGNSFNGNNYQSSAVGILVHKASGKMWVRLASGAFQNGTPVFKADGSLDPSSTGGEVLGFSDIYFAASDQGGGGVTILSAGDAAFTLGALPANTVPGWR